MKKLYFAALLLGSTAAIAQQTATPQPAPQTTVTVAPLVSVPGPDASTRIIRGGAQVRVRFLHELTTEDRASSVGQRVRLEVAEDVVADGVTIIPRGTPVTGELTAVRNKGMWGRSGKIEGRILNMTLNGRTVRMSGAFDDKGVTGTAGVVAAVVLVPIVGFFVTGTSARIPAGGEVSAYIDEDVVFSVTAAPAPVPVPAVAAEQPVVASPAQ
jgi:hypothetical protein